MSSETYKCLECGVDMESSTRQLCGKTQCDYLGNYFGEDKSSSVNNYEKQIIQEFGEDVLDRHFRLYCDVINIEKHYLRCNNYPETEIDKNVNMKEVHRKFFGLLEEEFGVLSSYRELLKVYFDTRYNNL
jgi:hypothetical protein